MIGHGRIRIVAILAFALGLLVFLFCSGGAHTQAYEPLLLWLVLPLSLGLLAYGMRKCNPLETRPWLCLCLLVPWWLLCTIPSGQALGMDAYQLKMLALIAFSAGVSFPFAKLTGDVDDRRLLNALLCALVLGGVVLWSLAYVGVLRDELFTIAGLTYGADHSESGRLIMRVAGMHPYSQGFIASALALIVCYLVATRPTRPAIACGLAAELVFLPAVVISGGRMVIGGLAVGFLYLLALSIQMTNVSRRSKLALIAFATTVSCVILVAGMNLVYRYVTHSIRDVWYGAATLTSRTDIWHGTFASFADHPAALVVGYPGSDAMDIINHYIPLSDWIVHTHSSYVQMLAIHGIPGLALALVVVGSVMASGFKLLRAGASEGVTFADKLLFAVPLSIAFESITEVILFASYGRCLVANALFMLLSGYVVFTAEPHTGTKVPAPGVPGGTKVPAGSVPGYRLRRNSNARRRASRCAAHHECASVRSHPAV